MFQELSSGVWFCASSRQQHSKTATSSRQQNNNIFFEVSTVLVESKKKLLNLFLCCEINSKFLFFPPQTPQSHSLLFHDLSPSLCSNILHFFTKIRSKRLLRPRIGAKLTQFCKSVLQFQRHGIRKN